LSTIYWYRHKFGSLRRNRLEETFRRNKRIPTESESVDHENQEKMGEEK
jgi:hypothetical protein